MLSAERCGGEKGYEGQKGIKMAKLKPCPFCGGTDLDYGVKKTDNIKDNCLVVLVWVECCVCGSKTRAVSFLNRSRYEAERAFDRAERAWNRRADDG